MDLEEPEKAGIGDWDGHRGTGVGRGAAQTRPLCLLQLPGRPVVGPEAHMEEFSSQDFPAEPEVLPSGHRSRSEAQSQLTDTSDPTKTLGAVGFLYKPHQNALKTHPGEPFVLPQLRRENWDNSRGPRITPRSCQVLPAPSSTCHNPRSPSRHPSAWDHRSGIGITPTGPPIPGPSRSPGEKARNIKLERRELKLHN